MSEMNINRVQHKPAESGSAAAHPKKQPAVSPARTEERQAAKPLSEQPLEKRTDTLLLSRQARAHTQAAADRPAGAAFQRVSGESDEQWMRRLISHETESAWRANSRRWNAESQDMGFADSLRYQEQKATEWVAGLMSSDPAMFREWLGRERWHMEEGGLDHAILPQGFTEEEFARWMEKDVLDYL